MTEQLERLEREGNIKRIGRVYGFSDRAERFLSVVCDGWDPAVADMFYIDGFHGVNPITREDTGQDCGLIVSRVVEVNTIRAILELGYPIITGGLYQNAFSVPPQGAALYQPAGAHLKAIWERWLETAP